MGKNRIMLALLGLFAVTSSSLADGLPKRQPGLWEIKIANGAGLAGHRMKQCVDETTDAKMMQMGQEMKGAMKEACSKQEITRIANGFASSTECNFGGSKMSSKGTFTGDFTSSYRGEVTTTFDPPLMGQGTQKVEISGKWLGACPATMKPGDMAMDNGMNMNVDDLSRQAEHVGEKMKSLEGKNAAQMLNDPEVQRSMRQSGRQLDASQQEAIKKALEQMGNMQQPK